MYYKTLGKRLRTLRKVNEISIKEITAHLKCTSQQYYKYESGINKISIIKLLTLLKLYENVDIVKLIKERD